MAEVRFDAMAPSILRALQIISAAQACSAALFISFSPSFIFIFPAVKTKEASQPANPSGTSKRGWGWSKLYQYCFSY